MEPLDERKERDFQSMHPRSKNKQGELIFKLSLHEIEKIEKQLLQEGLYPHFEEEKIAYLTPLNKEVTFKTKKGIQEANYYIGIHFDELSHYISITKNHFEKEICTHQTYYQAELIETEAVMSFLVQSGYKDIVVVEKQKKFFALNQKNYRSLMLDSKLSESLSSEDGSDLSLASYGLTIHLESVKHLGFFIRFSFLDEALDGRLNIRESIESFFRKIGIQKLFLQHRDYYSAIVNPSYSFTHELNLS